jgi:hypothetical protein
MAPSAGGFPIPDYDNLMMLQILPMLNRLDAGQLQLVRQHEAAGLSRSTLLNRVDRLLEQQRGAGAAAAARVGRPGPRKATARRAPAKKAAVKRAPARKAAASKRPAAKRAAAIKKAPARKAAATRAPARKTTARKVTAKKVTAKKAVQKRTAQPRKRI